MDLDDEDLEDLGEDDSDEELFPVKTNAICNIGSSLAVVRSDLPKTLLFSNRPGIRIGTRPLRDLAIWDKLPKNPEKTLPVFDTTG